MRVWNTVEKVPRLVMGGAVLVLGALATWAIWDIAQKNGDPNSRALAWIFTLLMALFYIFSFWFIRRYKR